MAKQISIEQGDYGIVIRINLLKEDNSVFKISDIDNVLAHIQFPSGDCIEYSGEHLTITDKATGLIRIEIPKEYTKEEGYYQIFIELESDTYKINASKSIGYYVNARHGIGEH